MSRVNDETLDTREMGDEEAIFHQKVMELHWQEYENETIRVPIEYFKRYPNDYELGDELRKFYNNVMENGLNG